MSKVIPILPCANIEQQCGFYESIGFTVIGKYKRPNAYAIVQYEDIVLHFWCSKSHKPEENASMVYIEVTDVDATNEQLCSRQKENTGRVTRRGYGRITKTRLLKEDRRFTLCDPAGNTIYIGTPQSDCAERTLESERHAKMYSAAYDIMHSHEETGKAMKTIPKLKAIREEISAGDRAKVDVLIEQIEEAEQKEKES